ncbi:MAG: transposase [Betaproteobacteria bacterium]|nr:transposase [Betaproteobacteria bacterium]
MSRPLRIEYSGALYHLTLRGNARGEIFLDDTDREIFLDVLRSVVERFGWRVYAYCLMGNHYHLLAETPQPNLSDGMRWLNGVYTQRFNRRHGRVGHVFQGRFKAILVESESYLLELARYIVLNPVRAGLTSTPGRWRWSSYGATAGERAAPRWLSVNWILGQFGNSDASAENQYREFVAAGLNRDSPWSNLRGQVLLGTEPFVQALTSRLDAVQNIAEMPQSQRLAHRPALMNLLPASDGRSKAERDAAIRDAHIRHAYTFAEIARHVGLHYTTVSRIANRPQHQGKT